MKITVNDVTKVYRKGPTEIRALDGVSVEFDSASFAVIWGVSGSGKSTLLNLVGGLDVPTSGGVNVDGVELTSLASEALSNYRREKVGFVFQGFNLVPPLTVFENVMLPLVPLRLPAQQKARQVEVALGLVGLEERMNHLPGELSGGEQQRAAIARALVNDPPLILADEPTSDLDTTTGESIIALLKTLSEQGRTVLLATHDHRILAQASQRVTLEDGKMANTVS